MIIPSLKNAVQGLEKKASLRGSKIDFDKMHAANSAMGYIIPEWYIFLVTNYAISGLSYSFKSIHANNIHLPLNPSDLVVESLLKPTLAFLKDGYFPFGIDTALRGDAFLLRKNQENTSAVFQGFHDPLSVIEIDSSLSHFFENLEVLNS